MDKLIDRLKAIDTPTLSNAIEQLKVRNRTSGFCDRSLKCFFPQLGVMCGYAITAQVETMTPDRSDIMEKHKTFIELVKAVQESPGPCVVVLQETTGRQGFSVHCGDIMASLFKRTGAVGLVSDSAVRDKSEVEAAGFHYFATGLVASHANFRILRIQVPVTICGLVIKPGDLLHGDVNGLITVTEQGREQLPQLVEKVQQRESKLLNFISSDQFTPEGFYDLLIN